MQLRNLTQFLLLTFGATTGALAFAQNANSSAVRYDKAALTSAGTYERFIIRYQPGSPEYGNATKTVTAVSQAAIQGGTLKAASLSANPVKYIRQLAIGAEVVQLPQKLAASDALLFMQALAADPDVLFVEPDVMDTIDAMPLAATLPNDPQLSEQWHLTDPDGGINVVNAWPKSIGMGITVAVIDTGITTHPDLDTSLAASSYDFTSTAAISGRTSNGRAAGAWDLGDWTTTSQCGSGIAGRSSSWHGTHVAGTIAEKTNNSIGGAGIAYGATLLPIRALGHCGGLRSDITDAIVWASGGSVNNVPANRNPALVINMSLGGTGTCTPGSAYAQAINTATRNGSIIVVAAGNDGVDAATAVPANCPGVITVGATGITSRRAYYSNYGTRIDIAAPGGGVYANDAASGTVVKEGYIYQTLNDGATTPGNPIYGLLAGTSMASPHVAGVVAMVLNAQLGRGKKPFDTGSMRLLLRETARPFKIASDKPIGPGILDAYAALTRAIDDSSPLISALSNRIPLGNQQSKAGIARYYAIDVPAGASNLSLRTYGGTGDVTLYVGDIGTIPTVSTYAYRSARAGNTEMVTLATPAAGRYYLMVQSASVFANLTVLASYAAP